MSCCQGSRHLILVELLIVFFEAVMVLSSAMEASEAYSLSTKTQGSDIRIRT